MAPYLMDHIGLNRQVLMNKLRGIGVISIDTTYLCCSQEYVLGLVLLKKIPNSPLVDKIELHMGTCDDIFVSAGLESPDKGRTNETPVASYVNLALWIHVHSWRLKVE